MTSKPTPKPKRPSVKKRKSIKVESKVKAGIVSGPGQGIVKGG